MKNNWDTLKGFLPWILLGILSNGTGSSLTLAAGFALLLNLILSWKVIFKGFILEVGGVIFFALLFAHSFLPLNKA